LNFHHFIENCNTQSLLHKMNDDERHKKLINAIDKNDTATISSLISSGGANLIGKPWPLHHAAEFGSVEIMTMLLDAGADINAVDENFNTACHVSILFDQFDVLKLLVARGANLGVFGANITPLLLVAARHREDSRMLLYLLDAGASLVNLSPANLVDLVAISRSVDVLARLLARNVDVSALRDSSGGTLCHRVIGDLAFTDRSEFVVAELVRALVDVARVDVNAVYRDGTTSLHDIASTCNFLALRLLLELGADVNQQESDGWTALHRLCRTGWPGDTDSCIELLLACGADTCLATDQAQTVCHWAALSNGNAQLCALIAAGGNLDQPDNDGNTPRSIAFQRGVELPTDAQIDAARRRIAKTRLDLVRRRAFQICVGLRPLNLDALQTCEIMAHACGAFGALIAFHQWWAIATKVKHFRTTALGVH
jgi:ankyrin repeat protein